MSFAVMPLGSSTMSTDNFRPNAKTVCFSVRADVHPGTLPRLIERFAQRNLVPSSVQARVIGAGDVMAVDIHVLGLDRVAADIIAEGMRQMVPVERVLVAELADLGAAREAV